MRPSAQPFLWKWVVIEWEWKIISISKAVHWTSFWYRGPGELGNGLFLLPPQGLRPEGEIPRRHSSNSRVYQAKYLQMKYTVIQSQKRSRFAWTAAAITSHACVFRGARFSSFPTNACSTENNIPFPLFYLRGKWPINSFEIKCWKTKHD